jgi:DNA repair exonuclease SbcCD nuclease subunit
MRLVHLSDLHLGYRQYQRLTPGGVNQREADVAATFRAAIDRVIALRPDVVVVAGDIFHSVRPTNQAILHGFMQFSRLMRALPDAVIVLVAGNHDTPRSAETGGILQLFAQLGLYVVDREPRRLSFPDRELSIFALPGVPGMPLPSLTLDTSMRYNVLVAHGRVPGVVPEAFPGESAGSNQFAREELLAARWDYVAMGDYHVHQEVGHNAYYSGSIEYTSLNPWHDLQDERDAGLRGKGFIERDLESGDQTFHDLPIARPLIDLPRIAGKGLSSAEIDERIRETVERIKGGIDDKIVRLVVHDVTRQVAREIDHKAIREYKRRALNFHLDLRRPELFRRESTAGGPGRRTVELKDVVAEKLRERPLEPGVDRETFVSRGLEYLDAAKATSVAPTALLES